MLYHKKRMEGRGAEKPPVRAQGPQTGLGQGRAPVPPPVIYHATEMALDEGPPLKVVYFLA